MSFDWSEFLSLARELAATSSPPAKLRTAISRAYYAAFHQARIHLEREGAPIKRDVSDHWKVKRTFQESPDLTRKEIGETLDRLHKDRKRADYDDRFGTGLADTAEGAVRDAAEVLRALSSLAGPPKPR